MHKYRLTFLIIMLSLSTQILAKVAYLPLLRHNYDVFIYGPTATEIVVVDLNDGQKLRTITIGKGAGPVFLSHDDTQLYAAAEYENKIVLIDAKELKITKSWDQLPIMPKLIFLNQAGNILYFSDESELYAIDLENDQVELKLTGYADYYHSWLYNKDLSHLMIFSGSQVDTFDLNTLANENSFAASLDREVQMSASGDIIFHYDSVEEKLVALDASDGMELWSFEPQSEARLQIANEHEGYLTVVGQLGTYNVDVSTGQGQLSSSFTLYEYGHFGAHWDSGFNDENYLALSEVEIMSLTGWQWLASHLNY